MASVVEFSIIFKGVSLCCTMSGMTNLYIAGRKNSICRGILMCREKKFNNIRFAMLHAILLHAGGATLV